MDLKSLIANSLRYIADNIENGACEMTEEQAMQFFEIITREPMSKESACEFLNISRATFDNHVRDGLIPKGCKRRGFKELVWYKSDLIKISSEYKK